MITNTIAKNAGIIYQLLNLKKEVQVAELLSISCLEISDFYIALGWLAREGRVSFIIVERSEVIISKTED